jgi:hypothetical protein
MLLSFNNWNYNIKHCSYVSFHIPSFSVLIDLVFDLINNILTNGTYLHLALYTDNRKLLIFQVFESRHELLQEENVEPTAETVCLTHGEYYGLVSAVIIILIVLIIITAFAGICYR